MSRIALTPGPLILILMAHAAALASTPVFFEANRGQAAPDVAFVARGTSCQLALMSARSVLTVQDRQHRVSTTLALALENSNPRASLEGLDPLAAQAHWITDEKRVAPLFARVRASQVYPGIDLIYYGNDGRIEFDFVVQPGARPQSIRFAIEGANRLRLDAAGDLTAETAAGPVRVHQPVVYELIGDRRHSVEGKFILEGGSHVRFRIGAHDPRRVLVIDPTLGYLTFLGGRANDAARGIALDAAGNVYIAGSTTSDNLPNTRGSYQAGFGGLNPTHVATGDAFVAKFTSAGALLWVSYVGGSGDDVGTALAVDPAGNVYLTGYTNSTNFRTTAGAYQRTFAGGGSTTFAPGDAFVVKLKPDGSDAIYATYLGGNDDDLGMAIAIDKNGNAYVAGATQSTNFRTTSNAFQRTYKGGGGNLKLFTGSPVAAWGDVFVVELNAAGSDAVFCTLLGGALDDFPSSIALDVSGNVYVAGATLSTNFPTKAAFQSASKGAGGLNGFKMGEAFVAKLKPDGSDLLYSTYLGGSADDAILAMAVDSSGAAYLTGFTSSGDFPTTAGSLQRTFKGPTARGSRTFLFGDGFVAKLKPDGSGLAYSTYFGGSDDDAGVGITVDATGNAYVVGFTNSRDVVPTADAIQKTFGGSGGHVQASGDGFLLKLDPAGATALFLTYLGWSLDDGLSSIVLDSDGNAWIAGNTLSTSVPVTPDAAQKTFGGGSASIAGTPAGDALLAKIILAPPPPPPPPTPVVTLTGIVNDASTAIATAVSAGEIVILSGNGMGPKNPVAGTVDPASGLQITKLSGARYLFDNFEAPIISASDQQSIVIVPYAVDGNAATHIVAEFNGAQSTALVVPVAAAAPGVFTADNSGIGQGLIANPDGTPNSADNPAPQSSVIAIDGTGEGQTMPAGLDGLIAGDTPPNPVQNVSVSIEGQDAQVLSASGITGKPAGYFRVFVQLPDGLDPGDQPVVITVGSISSQAGVTVAIAPPSDPVSDKPVRRAK